jgi:hypothetical protein
MPLRDTLTQVFGRPAVRALSGTIRQLVEEILSSRRFATPEDVASLRRDLDAARAPAASNDDARVKALEAEIASLKKRLGMAQGALQAAAQQIADAKKGAEEAVAVAKQAAQNAQSALTAAESAADGAHELESRPARGPAEASQSTGPEVCAVPGCGAPVRARGMCGRHYAQWKRGSLDEFVSGDGSVRFADGSSFKLASSYAGNHATLTPVGVSIDGKVVPSEPG